MKTIDLKLVRRSIVRGDSLTQMANSVGLSKSGARRLKQHFLEADIKPATLLKMTDEGLENVFRPRKRQQLEYVEPNWDEIYARIHSKKYPSNLKNEWLNYKNNVGKTKRTMSYSTFCRACKQFGENLPDSLAPLIMSYEWPAGDVMMIDYSGDGIAYVDNETGEVKIAQIFVAVLPYSNYSFCYATVDQTRQSWFDALNAAIYFFKAVPNYIFIDNSTSLVLKASKYEPTPCLDFVGFCEYYNTIPFPLTPHQPKEKATCERLVGILQKSLFSECANREFFSVEEINRTLSVLLEVFNGRELTDGTHESRSLRFERELPYLKPVPALPYDINITIKRFKVRRDYCVRYRGHRYSVPHRYTGSLVKLIERPLPGTIDIYDADGQQIAHHILKADGQGDSVLFEHMPNNHRFVLAKSEERLKRLQSAGCYVEELARHLTSNQPERIANKTLQGMESERRRVKDDAFFNECCRKALVQGKTSLTALMKLCDQEHTRINKKINRATQLEIPLTKTCMRGKSFFEASSGEDDDDDKEN